MQRFVIAFAGAFLAFFVLSATSSLYAQQGSRYYRLWLTDKGTPERVLPPSDPLYDLATAHITPRALARRAKVLAADSLVTTADLPVRAEYLEELAALGVEIAQTSRWFNTAMIRTDSATFEIVRALPFVREAEIVGTSHSAIAPAGKQAKLDVILDVPPYDPQTDNGLGRNGTGCISTQYGLAARQNYEVGFDAAHAAGFAGEGVFIGVLDAGFDWRSHEAMRGMNVVAERDFVYDDSIAYDEPDENGSESHGTIVTSVIGAYLPGELVGGAPRATFALAKTEDTRSERHVEEDHFVAGLEWLEGLGVDVTNASLGYTVFDDPEKDHTYEELDGKTAFASRGINMASRLGVLCVLSAGNEFGTFRYVSVPAEADSALAVAALDTANRIANFSSRGFGGRTRIKPDIAAPGVKVFGASSNGASNAVETGIESAQGTSLAAPLVTAAAAVILSADPSLRPWEVRELLTSTARRADRPDTAVGNGLIDVEGALAKLSDERTIVGMPTVRRSENGLSVAAWVADGFVNQLDRFPVTDLDGIPLEITILNLRNERATSLTTLQRKLGPAVWILPQGAATLDLAVGDRVEIAIGRPESPALRRDVVTIGEETSTPASTLCFDAPLPTTLISVARPNPFREATRIEFVLDEAADVALDVFNVKGEQVLHLLDRERRDPGFYSVLVLPKDLPSGAYYYRLVVNDAVYSEKMIYLR